MNKVSAWKSIAIRAQNNKMKRLQKQESTRNLSRKDVGDSMPIKQGSVHFPLAEDLIGTDLVANYYQKHSSESEVEKSGLVRAIAVKLKNYKDRLAFLSTTVNMNMKKRIQYVRGEWAYFFRFSTITFFCFRTSTFKFGNFFSKPSV